MEWIVTIQDAINYMEEHILEDIKYEDIPSVVNFSTFHFHSAFSMIVGMTASEYIRRRRLSLAGQELTMSNAKIIDIAYKYGYDSPEGFTKAFTRFHNITPMQAKRPGAKLVLFSPIKMVVSVKGGDVMDYRIEQIEKITLIAKTREFSNEKVNEDSNHDIPDFWSECYSDGTMEQLDKFRTDKANIAVCTPISKTADTFKYSIGVRITKEITPPEGFELVTVDAGMFAVFQCFGKDESCMEDVWPNIITEFFPQSGYDRRYAADFEVYPCAGTDLFSEVWVPVSKK